MKKLLFVTAVLAAAVFVFVSLSLPPRRLGLTPPSDGTVAGIVHVHTNRSDGLSSPDEVAAAAARAGLKFLVFTDHGDATREPDPPAYRAGVLCLDGVEISTNDGHYIAIDMPAAPYPLAGDARDVVEDVRRLGGFGIAAHPDSPKPELQWTDWDAPFDGIELLNLDTSWRVLAAQPGLAPKRRLLAALFAYPFRGSETIANLVQSTSFAAERWVVAARERRVATLAGADAHAKLSLRSTDPGNSPFVLRIPGYETSFRVMSIHARLERPFAGNAASDAAVLVRAIRNGHLYTVIDGLAAPPSFVFTATNALGTVHEGDVLGLAGPVRLRIESNAPAGFVTIVRKGELPLATVPGTQTVAVDGGDGDGVFWAEIVAPDHSPPITWIRSNPIYVRRPEPVQTAAATARPAAESRPIFDGVNATGWHVEQDRTSVAALDVGQVTSGGELRFRFGLAGGDAVGQVVALSYDTPSGVLPSDRVTFSIRAERPMRISLQVRDAAADRWQRSVYIDATLRERTVSFAELMPVGVTRSLRPDLGSVRNLLFVVDTTNTKPGTSGRIWIRRAMLHR